MLNYTVLYFLLSRRTSCFAICDFDLRTSHARELLLAELASVLFGFVLVLVRVRVDARARVKSAWWSLDAPASPGYEVLSSRLQSPGVLWK